jgi:hypothetical protein
MRNRPYALHVFALVFAVLTMPLGHRLAEGQEEFKTEIVPNVGPGVVSSLAFSRDGRMALSGGHPPKLWDVGSGRLLRTFGASGASVAFSPDERTALSWSWSDRAA